MDIAVAGLEKRFGETAALHGVDLSIRAGELVALLGPSGSGKTTLLRVIAGLEQPDSGQVRFGDLDATDIPVQQRQVGFVFQHYALFRHLTVFENIAYGLRARPRHRRPNAAEIRDRVHALLSLVQLDGLQRRFPAQLSGGQKQRVALARALAVEPRVLLLDEPFGALDAKVRKDLRRWLREIHERTGQTTIFVTHDQDEALELADRVAILNGGRIEQFATPSDVYDRPASPFVMNFVGETSHVPVEVRTGRVVLGGQAIDLRSDEPDGPADLYVRPTDVKLASEGVSAHTLTTWRRGPLVRLQLQLADVPARLEVDVPAQQAAHLPQIVRLRFRGGRIFTRPSNGAALHGAAPANAPAPALQTGNLAL